MITHPLTAILLDRDGTVIYDKHYLADPDGVALLPGAAKGLGMLAYSGAGLYLVSNQSGIGRGMFSEADLQACHNRLCALLAAQGIALTDALHCPHAPEEACSCRKPATGMWETLKERHGLRPEHTAMIGDKKADIAFGLAAKLAVTVLVLTGKGESEAARMGLPPLPPGEGYALLSGRQPGWPHIIARDLHTAASALLASTKA